MNITALRRFVVAADELHFPRAAQRLGIPLASLYSSLDKLEAEVGHALFVRAGSSTRLTPAGALLLADARDEVARSPEPAAKPAPAGGKAKASKGRGRAPVVKGEPKPYKKRQGR